MVSTVSARRLRVAAMPGEQARRPPPAVPPPAPATGSASTAPRRRTPRGRGSRQPVSSSEAGGRRHGGRGSPPPAPPPSHGSGGDALAREAVGEEPSDQASGKPSSQEMTAGQVADGEQAEARVLAEPGEQLGHPLAQAAAAPRWAGARSRAATRASQAVPSSQEQGEHRRAPLPALPAGRGPGSSMRALMRRAAARTGCSISCARVISPTGRPSPSTTATGPVGGQHLGRHRVERGARPTRRPRRSRPRSAAASRGRPRPACRAARP